MFVVKEDNTLFICCTELILLLFFLPESAYLKKKDGNFCHLKRTYSNKTNQRSTGYYLRNVFLKLKCSLMLLILYWEKNKAQSID